MVLWTPSTNSVALDGIAKNKSPLIVGKHCHRCNIVGEGTTKGGNTMVTLHISMPHEMRAFIEARVSTGEYQSASDYLRDLIKHDREETERLLVEGLESGIARPLDMATLRSKAQALLKQDKVL
jgi:antitoxin ParD1/3/4